jgi:hypothetical protein
MFEIDMVYKGVQIHIEKIDTSRCRGWKGWFEAFPRREEPPYVFELINGRYCFRFVNDESMELEELIRAIQYEII